MYATNNYAPAVCFPSAPPKPASKLRSVAQFGSSTTVLFVSAPSPKTVTFTDASAANRGVDMLVGNQELRVLSAGTYLLWAQVLGFALEAESEIAMLFEVNGFVVSGKGGFAHNIQSEERTTGTSAKAVVHLAAGDKITLTVVGSEFGIAPVNISGITSIPAAVITITEV